MPVFLEPAKAPTLEALLAEVFTDGLSWHIEAETMPHVAGIGTLGSAGPSEITFLANAHYAEQLGRTHAAAVILTPEAARALDAGHEPAFARVVCSDPYLLYARVAQWFDAQMRPAVGTFVHPSAVVADDAVLEDDVCLGPQVVIEGGTRIGRGSVIGAGCVIGADCEIGPASLLHARVTLYSRVRIGARAIVHSGAVLGADGFGFAPDAMAASRGERGRWVKIPQLGGVVIGDDVEIGANTTIDRGALEDTAIGHGVKLDNQIMIAHNVRVGDFTAMAACVGIAGSTRIGSRCTLGGAAMISGHLELGDDVHISGGTLVSASIAKPGRYTAVYPLAEHGEWQRNAAVVQQLARLRRRLQAVERGQEPS
jgi:UDP-3-O-[3-hydroxymyristoyl] glucosamine N-acyltransferase